ncbi:ATP-binding protein, partial [candidate division KSB1 bacterium]
MPDIPEEDFLQDEGSTMYLEHSLQYLTEEYVTRMRELSLIKRIAEALTGTINLEKVCLDIISIVLDEIHAEHCSLYLIDKNEGTLVLKAQQSQENLQGEYFDNNGKILGKIGEGIAGTVFTSRSPQYIKDLRRKKNVDEGLACDPLCRSILLLPLFSGDHSIGIMCLSAPEVNAFSDEDRNILQIISHQASIVLNNVQLLESLQRTNQELAAAQQDLAQHAQDLEKMVDQRTKELIHSEKMAAIGHLIAGVSHELNNPLAIITGYVDILSSKDDIPKRHIEKLNKVKQATTRCLKIVNNLLRLSRKSKLEKETININYIIDETLELYDHQFRLNNISVIKKLEKDLPYTIGDSQQIQQVILNLISNAKDALLEQESGRYLTIKTQQIDEMILLEIIDNGPGIQPDNHDKIYEPFFSTKEVGKGTGLGLSLSKEIMLEHNGDLICDESFIDGARFLITIPISEESIEMPEEDINIKNVINESTCILLIDDEKDIVAFQRDVLELYSCQVDGVHYAQEALDRIASNTYDVIIMDINTPGEFNGKNFYEKIMEIDPDIKDRIIFTSGSDTDITAYNLPDSDKIFSVKKPFIIKDYLAAICKRL